MCPQLYASVAHPGLLRFTHTGLRAGREPFPASPGRAGAARSVPVPFGAAALPKKCPWDPGLQGSVRKLGREGESHGDTG